VLPTPYCVIVNWNLWPDTAKCVESLLAAQLPLDRVIVVDNASHDDSMVCLKARFGPGLSVLASPRNVGYGGGCNLGIERALEHGAEWILLLNNDTYVAPTFFSEFGHAIERGPQYAAFGPLIMYARRPDRIWRLGERRVLGSLITHSLYRDALEPKSLPNLLPVDFVTGCAMLVRADVFKRAGTFDTLSFMYAEDVDFCWRMHLAGYRLAAAPRAKMWHKVSASSNLDRPAAGYWRVQNQIQFYRRYAGSRQIPILLLFTVLQTMWLITGGLISGQMALIRPLARGWIDGWLKPEAAAAKDLQWNR
jgi:GT2 family glycosyltransferase